MQRSSLDLPRFGSGLGLARVAELGVRLQVDFEALGQRVIAVAGSNGKGSVARMLAASLESAGRRTALFTSPHLFAFNERFEIDGAVLGDEPVLAAEARVGAAVLAYRADHGGEAVGAFEASFLTACLLFQEAGPDDLIFEVGIGGRYDPVRLLKAPLSALVSVDLEHTQLLGDTLEEIALDKLDICPPGGRIVAGPSLEAIGAVLAVAAEAKGMDLVWASRSVQVEDFQDAMGGAKFDLVLGSERIAVETRMHGRHQAENAALAFNLLTHRLVEQPHRARVAAFQQGMAGLVHAGRLEVFAGALPVVLDVAHTPAAMRGVLNDLDTLLDNARGVALVAVSADKAYEALLEMLSGRFGHFIIGRAHKSLAPAEVAATLRRLNPSAEIEIAVDAQDALARGRAVASRAGGTFLAGLGGLFWAASLRAALTGQDADPIRFD